MEWRKFHNLQIMRGIAAAMVVMDHSISSTWPGNELAVAFGHRLGDTGVGIFFVVSGFIMVHVSERDFGQPGAAGKFISRRIQRIVPMYWLATILVAIIIYIRKQQDLNSLVLDSIKSLFFIPYVNLNGLVRPVHTVGWTLNLEMLFYVIFCACLFIPSKRASILTAATVIIGLVATGAIFISKGRTVEPTTVGQFSTFPILILFAFGMLIRLYLPILMSRFHIYDSSLVFLLLPVTFLAFTWNAHMYQMNWYLQSLLWFACAAYVAGSIMFQGADCQRDIFSRGLETLGDASYSTYLFHLFALSAIKVFAALFPSWSWAKFVLCLVVAHAVGLVVHQGIEAPLQRYFASLRPKRAAALASS